MTQDEQQDTRQMAAPLRVLVVVGALLIFCVTIYSLPLQGDWPIFYQVACHPLAPYRAVQGFFNPIWMAWILAPFSLLPERAAGALWICLSTLAAMWSMHRLKGDHWGMLLCLTSPAFIRFITAGQLDAVPLLGLAAMVTTTSLSVRGLGLVLMVAKPQTLGGGALVVWLRSSWRERLWLLLPLVAVFLLSIMVHGLWPLRLQPSILNVSIDVSPWPYGIPFGLALLAWGAARNQPEIGALATYFLVPYVGPYSLFAYTAVLFAFAPKWASITVYVLMWALALTTL